MPKDESMSYDLYCYRSELGSPDLNEAIKVVDVKEGEEEVMAQPRAKIKIAMRLMEFNPRLEGFKFDYDEIAKFRGTSVEEAKVNFTHIELNTPDWDLATHIAIFDNIVAIEVPYLYTGADAEKVFAKVDLYTKIINQTAGYFVYDPQTVHVYDPSAGDFDGLSVYKRLSGLGDMAEVEKAAEKKWFKFW